MKMQMYWLVIITVCGLLMNGCSNGDERVYSPKNPDSELSWDRSEWDETNWT